jgi:23S rRNA pseudouridine1911/1915/1917 synthase
MQSIIIDQESDSDQRIDKFLKKIFPNASLGVLYKWLRTGKIKVNKKKKDQTYRIELDDIIDIYITDEEIRELISLPEKKHPQFTQEKKYIPFLYEDEDFIVINKPPWMNVHPGDHKSTESSVIEMIHDQLEGKYDSLSFRPSLVHRIDRDTSGVLLIAKNKKMLEMLLTLLQSGKIEKIYHTLIIGKPEKSRYTITARLERIENAKNEAKVIVSPNWQEAITHYRVLQEYIVKKYSLLECRIETGRTHQIRVHMASIGNPILGDKAYGNRWENSFALKTYQIQRQLLHAFSLSFIHPRTQKLLRIEAPYPDDFQELIHHK